MDFQSLNRLNAFLNVLSGNLLPVKHGKPDATLVAKIYSIFVVLICTAYLSACILGALHVPLDKALRDGTVNFVVNIETILLIVHFHWHADILRELIEKLNSALAIDDETLRHVVIGTVRPLQNPFLIYTILSVGSVAFWTSMPLVKVFQKDWFLFQDYSVPFKVSAEPFPASVFVLGVAFQLIGAVYAILRKISLDVYTIHFILLLTAQYRYFRERLCTIFRNERSMVCWKYLKGGTNANEACEGVCGGDERIVRKQLRALTRHHKIVVETSVLMQKVLSTNIGILYITNVFRFCFLSIMYVMMRAADWEMLLVGVYALNALLQLYIFCFYVQQLLEASESFTDDAFHEKWYTYDVSLQQTFRAMIFANKLKCNLSSLKSIGLTLSSFVSILNHAYSVCLLVLRVN